MILKQASYSHTNQLRKQLLILWIDNAPGNIILKSGSGPAMHSSLWIPLCCQLHHNTQELFVKMKGDTNVDRLAALFGTRVHQPIFFLFAFSHYLADHFLAANQLHRDMADFFAGCPLCHN